MDPLTLAAERFVSDHEAAWDPPPPAAQPPRVVALFAPPEDRRHVIKSLRFLEAKPKNRRPFSIVEERCLEERAYWTAVFNRVLEDVGTVDRGLAEEGVNRPAIPKLAIPQTAHELIDCLCKLAEHLTPPLQGLVVVLAPRQVEDRRALGGVVGALLARPPSAALRVDVFAPDVEELAVAPVPRVAFVLDHKALWDHLKAIGSHETRGPRDQDPPPLTPEERSDIEQKTGMRLISPDAGRTLKRLIIEGVQALGDKRFAEAAKKYRAARALALGSGLDAQAILLTISLATTYFSAGKQQAAEGLYRDAARAAHEKGFAGVEVQALIGLGCGLFSQRRFDDAEVVYRQVAEITEPDSPLRKEAQRMIGLCIEHKGTAQ
ncbi:MAG: hypothetical protein U0271_16120 [Polyangiaceae bacterium]